MPLENKTILLKRKKLWIFLKYSNEVSMVVVLAHNSTEISLGCFDFYIKFTYFYVYLPWIILLF